MSAPKFTTLGCRLNAYETEAMKDLAEAAGMGNAVVVNTCAVTQEAVRKARQEIRRLRRENPDARVIVTGCAAQIDPASFAAMDEVDAVIGNTEKMAPDTWKGLAGDFIGETEKVQVNDIMSVTETAGHLIDGFGSRSRAYVQVQNGCDHRCTFCIIPYGRGNSRSVPAGVVVDQIRRLVDQGYNEVVLTGVDLTSWGADLPGEPRLGDLVMRILRLTDVPRLRISSIDSIEADDNLMLAIASEPRLMPHLHLSLQHGDDLILKRMKRRHLRDDAIRFCEEARRLRPEMTFGADIIAGFPTESEAHFENSLKLVSDCDLTWLHVFPYSARPGTPAARIPQQINGNVIKERAARLRAAGESQVQAHLAAQAGRDHAVLMEAPDMGRTEQFTEVRFAAPQPVGQIVQARITGFDGQQLTA
ncbi:threonylcarbamoyladenosine tRNA methylthiotransferase MtaB [Mameliella alba]|uniref:tRNA (N(6)-L-threonylcarbamoyladenosine(37)-C(2))- methylthiotransferase MtaB n=1 Tax=Mameliella alba TaxID=561184 RepID=UPI0008902C7B|nr:tRNA (N(6)-L-threonylcarbamoyladenosine(37)-C(2))-methylthiotransferase MtaB [Mameliella alba]OWV48591.1 tRNA (N(6)-L-threonylcarbamoyladenosine(37)-C(2))-methylthiotransferase MtaB [Mameliella alba]PTR39141.1 threonylcarbamoyladenosine tRNA methylthiotransferase MtaB [Mameliella alba]GGF63533.1 tRNA (N(6)-L-threonylcarbamoyladenosine(37)-C(2))-methylthiotransferase MtaB [Mameliella alba]SDD24130.1 threonylcarbamoyladenosine tRNA methylthiotransferase MtaB [Mameliella alba]